MKSLSKVRKFQLKLLVVILLLLIVIANELWINEKNTKFYNDLNFYTKNENDLNENKEYFLLAAEDGKINIMKLMMEARFKDPVLFDFIYIGNGLKKVNSKPETEVEINNLKQNYIENWNKWGLKVSNKDSDIFNVDKINCKLSIYCYYKKENLKKDIMLNNRIYKKQTIENIIKEFEKKES